MNKSFLKWAGNKYRVLAHILPLIGSPEVFIEPFAGSLSVALNVTASKYIVNDFNEDLIFLYEALQDETFIDECEEFFVNKNNSDDYYLYRKVFNTIDDKKLKSIIFVYLNRHCFNGLTRYNKSNHFNVPFGKYVSPYFPRKELENVKKILSNRDVQLFHGDFADSRLYSNVTENTVIYFDPPYLPISETANFSDYASVGFSYHDQLRLRDKAIELSKIGAKVIISNHDVPIAREIYSEASKIHSFDVARTISSKGNSRKPVKELLAIY